MSKRAIVIRNNPTARPRFKDTASVQVFDKPLLKNVQTSLPPKKPGGEPRKGHGTLSFRQGAVRLMHQGMHIEWNVYLDGKTPGREATKLVRVANEEDSKRLWEIRTEVKNLLQELHALEAEAFERGTVLTQANVESELRDCGGVEFQRWDGTAFRQAKSQILLPGDA